MRVTHWPYTYRFTQPAGTSRGILQEKEAHFIEIHGTRFGVPFHGIGECGLLRGLSFDDRPDYVEHLERMVAELNGWSAEVWDACWASGGAVPREWYESWSNWPSLQFAAEQALRSAYRNRSGLHRSDLYDTPWTREAVGMPINGLVWMGSACAMSESLESKLRSGFGCVKMKIGALRWEEEWNLLRDFRRAERGAPAELRVDANGAFNRDTVGPILNALAELNVHSIEQPLPASDREGLAYWCARSPVPIALDESLIGCVTPEQRDELLDTVKPAFVVLKPSFIGGWRGTDDWIQRAEKRNIGWWVTSALEGSVGLNAIAQGLARRTPLEMAQGLGTGGLYTNNFVPWTRVEGDRLFWNSPYPEAHPVGPWPEALRIHPETDPSLIQEVSRFLHQWFDDSDRVSFSTSGSTGAPKTVELSKAVLAASARATLDTLELAPGFSGALALSPARVGGALAIVRALVGQGTLDLTSVKRRPLESFPRPEKPWDLVSLVPQQALALAESGAHSGWINHLLLGGASCTPAEARRIALLAENRWLGFGMTETASHIALARLDPDHPDACTPDGRWVYQPVRGVRVDFAPAADSEAPTALCITAPHLGISQPLVTTDAGAPHNGGFVWHGRLDGVINSAGVKIFPESVEAFVAQCAPELAGLGFATSVPDSQWGERLIWLSETRSPESQLRRAEVWEELRRVHPHWVPKSEFDGVEVPRAAQGKVDRAGLRRLALDLWNARKDFEASEK